MQPDPSTPQSNPSTPPADPYAPPADPYAPPATSVPEQPYPQPPADPYAAPTAPLSTPPSDPYAAPAAPPYPPGPNPYAAPAAPPYPPGPNPYAAPTPPPYPYGTPTAPPHPAPYGGTQMHPNAGYPLPSTKQNQLGLISMILGIVSVPLGCCYLTLPLGVAALVTGWLGQQKVEKGLADNRGQALAGMICGAIGVLVSLGSIALSIIGSD
ncbi:DUF4190 domain-containing protein [Salinispora tropica]|uniref:DUF4190 domain-containing protein n=1 Tax=Salinispora tropica TaxID=168695 RepID=UPI0004903A24|nr:DUF4190 domain-containing protein [Salinispora tropica]